MHLPYVLFFTSCIQSYYKKNYQAYWCSKPLKWLHLFKTFVCKLSVTDITIFFILSNIFFPRRQLMVILLFVVGFLGFLCIRFCSAIFYLINRMNCFIYLIRFIFCYIYLLPTIYCLCVCMIFFCNSFILFYSYFLFPEHCTRTGCW